MYKLIFYVIQVFDMPKHEAMKALEIYKRAAQQVLSNVFYEINYCNAPLASDLSA